MPNILRDVIAQNRSGASVAIPSVCSAHPDVLRAALLLAKELGRSVIIEATSNQVNQFGGYTGMTPADFAVFVRSHAQEIALDPDQIVLGGDHLGPQVWRKGPADLAMAHAITMVSDYARAGFCKIHLDCSEGCASEPAQVDDQTAARRSALLAAACRKAAPHPDQISFVIGTEVPPPGGAHAGHSQTIVPTTPERAHATVLAHKAAFEDAGIAALWPQVCGLVVQPGVEFSPTTIHHLPADKNAALRAVLNDWDGIAFEAHSTDYQTPDTYPRLSAMGFAIQKVGPALTFAWRQAVYGLDAILHIMGARQRPLCDVTEATMLANPAYWQGHYTTPDPHEARVLRHFSYADRIRYYWADPDVATAVAGVFAAFNGVALSMPVLQQAFAPEVIVRAQRLSDHIAEPSRALVIAQVQIALLPYFFGAAHD